MSLPCGTILTVPKNTKMEGWVDYEASMGEIEPVYAGSVKLSLGMDESEVWKPWNSINLNHEPELKEAVFSFIENMILNDTRKGWEHYFELGVLPPIRNVFPKFGDYLGEFSIGSVSNPLVMPFIEHTENMLRPIGQSTEEPPKKLYSPLMGGKSDFDNTVPTFPSNFVLLAQRASIHNLESNPVFTSIDGGLGASIPPNISFKLLVCTKTHYPSVPLTHKLIIKEWR